MRFHLFLLRLIAGCFLGLVTFFGAVAGAQTTTLTITPISWDSIGLSHNKPETEGPNLFMIGARVANTGIVSAENVVAAFQFNTTNIYINLIGPSVLTVDSLAPGSHQDFYFEVEVTRTALAFDATREYVITAIADNAAQVSTPSPRQLYVEQLVEQNRNSTDNFVGPTKVYVGQTVEYVVYASTATNGYEQLVSVMNFPNTIFRFNSTNVTYTAPVGATGNKLYGDACGWNNIPGAPLYRSCDPAIPGEYVGEKVGGTVITTYNLTIVGTGTATVNNLIYDKSGASYHYNTDYGQAGISSFILTAALPAVVTGTIFHDVNGNGIMDPLEPGLEGVSVTVTGSNGIPVVVVTDANGGYTAELFAEGSTTITVDGATLPPGVVLTTANEPQNITAVDGTTVTATPIGYQAQNPVMTFSKSASASVVGSGATFNYTLSFANTALPSPLSHATSVVITDTLPRLVTWGDQVTFLGGSFSSGYTGTISETNGVVTISFNEDILGGASGFVTLTVKTVNPVPNQSIFNTATLEANNHQGTPITPLVDTASTDTSPLLVDIEYMGVSLRNGHLVFEWRTAAEYGTAGFDIYRVTEGAGKNTLGSKVQVNDSMLSPEGSPIEGASYSFVDPAPYDGAGLWGYLLVETEFSGETNSYGPAWYPGSPVGSTNSSVDGWHLF